MKLTSAKIVDLPKNKHDLITFDSILRGFGLRIRRLSSGVRRYWIIQYRAHGRARRMIVGDAEKVTAAQARERAKKLLAEVELGGDPQGDKHERREKDSLSLRSIVADFLEQKTGVKKETTRILTRYLAGPLYLGPLHAMPIDRIVRKDIAARLISVSKTNGIPTAIQFRAALSSFFTWAMQVGLVEHNPVVNSFKPPQPASRDRVLSDQELRAIWRGVSDDEYGVILKLLMLTGCRREEVGQMRWSEFDLKGTWTLPATRSKNGRPHTLPITPLMMQIIKSIPRRDERDLLFGRKPGGGFTSWNKGKVRLDQRLDLPDWTHHDIRRSVATGMADIGIQPHIIEAVLNHQSGHKRGPAGIYNRSNYTREVAAAMALWSDHVRSLIEGIKHKVIPFEQSAAVS